MAGKYRKEQRTWTSDEEVNVHFRVPHSTRKRLQDLAERRRMSVSATLVDFIDTCWADYEARIDDEDKARAANWGALPQDYQPPVKPTNDPELNNSLEWLARQRGQTLPEFMNELISSNVHKWINAVQGAQGIDPAS